MSMLELTRAELNKHNALVPQVNSLTQRVMNSIAFPTVPSRMKATVSITQLMGFASQFRRNVELWDGTLVPITSIGFVIAGSGAHKDASRRATKRCFSTGYKIIQDELDKQVRANAIRLAAEAGEELPDEYAVYRPYLKPIPPVDVTVTTGPGLIQHINDLQDLPLSSAILYSGEFADELSYNPDMVENIKILAETYDLGQKEMKYTKGVEHRSKVIENQAVSALFIGSPGYLLYDEPTKKKFEIAFMSKLARRSWFCYTPEDMPEPDFSTEPDPIDAMIAYKQAIDNESAQATSMLTDLVKDVTRYGISTAGTSIRVSDEVYRMYEVYRRYNSELADTLPNSATTSALIRRHLQWKAIKLAGAFALFDKSATISLLHYVEAIQFCELLDNDMARFEHELNKSYHERFSDFIATQVGPEGKAVVNIHDIKKHGFMSNVSKTKLQELITLCAGYDRHGIYSIINEGAAIQYEPIVKTDVLGVSYKAIDNSALNRAIITQNTDAIAQAKKTTAMSASYGFEVIDATFANLRELLEGDFAYSPFKFRNGTRGKDNIIGGTKWLVLDIDDSLVSAAEAHFMLMDLNHHIALSSDPTNDFKFRVIIELDSQVELSAQAWKHFYLSIADDLGLKVDPLPQSQIFFSYAGRPVLSQLDASPLEVRDYIMTAIETSTSKDTPPKPTPAQVRNLLADPLTTFSFLFEATDGSGSRSMIRAAYYARDLGATKEQTLQLLEDANEYWTSPMPEHRFMQILEQVSRLF